ncbi:Amine oxidase [Mycena sanguinolenta]|uniref:Amine oxidase n=1 Tax=Mycena sanguinolenta TaxID=230812 RepID=A0A8H6YDP0_9AGAR|nr:Amine oxidase [Mycena sanguinolenta]
MQRIIQFLLAVTSASIALAASTPQIHDTTSTNSKNDRTVLILGGGVSGIIAARTLAQKNITNFLIVEARDELGGRMRSMEFGAQGKSVTIELGANWIQGTQEGDGPANPILTLAREHGVKTVDSDFYGSVVTYDETGMVDYLDVLNDAVDAYNNLTVVGGGRVPTKQVDTTCRTGYSLIGAKPKTPADMVTEYYVDWEYAQTPEQTSWIASSWANNFTFDVDQGGFSDDNLLSIDQRGFKHLIQAEAETFLKPEQVLLNATVRTIGYSGDGVIITLANGTRISADYAISTFSVGVLQNDDVVFEPALPMWKQEAIQSMTMATYTKIFLQFDEKFWFDTQFALYADTTRGKYPVWQGLDLEGFLPGSGIIFATVVGDYSERIEALSDARVQAEALDVLHTMFPNITIPTPTAFFFPRWHSDPLYRGSYSNWPSSFVSQHHTNLRANLGKRLWFSGEAMSQKYFGFLHGAYFEGMDAGGRVAECVQSGGDCESLPFVESIPNSSPYII